MPVETGLRLLGRHDGPSFVWSMFACFFRSSSERLFNLGSDRRPFIRHEAAATGTTPAAPRGYPAWHRQAR